jgi:hypothetical protein
LIMQVVFKKLSSQRPDWWFCQIRGPTWYSTVLWL